MQYHLVLKPKSRGFHLIDSEVFSQLSDLPMSGVLHLFIKHTSAGLTINENCDSTVRADFETFFNNIVPDGYQYFSHTAEGPDDMPAHIKSSLMGNSLTIPICDGKPDLGTWQGIYLCEFRNNGGARKLIATVL